MSDKFQELSEKFDGNLERFLTLSKDATKNTLKRVCTHLAGYPLQDELVEANDRLDNEVELFQVVENIANAKRDMMIYMMEKQSEEARVEASKAARNG